MAVDPNRRWDLLDSQEHELQPHPGEDQHAKHVWKSKAEPAGKVDYVFVAWKKPAAAGKLPAYDCHAYKHRTATIKSLRLNGCHFSLACGRANYRRSLGNQVGNNIIRKC